MKLRGCTTRRSSDLLVTSFYIAVFLRYTLIYFLFCAVAVNSDTIRNRPERVASSSGFDATEFVSPRETDNGNGLYHQHTNYVNIPLSPSLRVDSTVSVAQHASAIEVQADAKPLNSGDDRGKLLKALEVSLF